MKEKTKTALMLGCVFLLFCLVSNWDYIDALEQENAALRGRMAQCGPYLRGMHMATIGGVNHVAR